MPLNGSVFGIVQVNGLLLTGLARDDSGKYPVSSPVGAEVFLPSPSDPLGWVFTLDPSPEHTEDVRVNLPKGLLAYYVLVVIGPASNNRVEPLHQ